MAATELQAAWAETVAAKARMAAILVYCIATVGLLMTRRGIKRV